MTSPPGYEHHIIGAVHEITLLTNSEPTARQALQHEQYACHAGRIIIDLTRITPSQDLLALIDSLADHERSTVRLRATEHPQPIDRLSQAS